MFFLLDVSWIGVYGCEEHIEPAATEDVVGGKAVLVPDLHDLEKHGERVQDSIQGE